MWDTVNKSCVFEVTVHRNKADEAINDVCFHPTLPFFVSSGADGTVKVHV